jgi:hypothetical protein
MTKIRTQKAESKEIKINVLSNTSQRKLAFLL